VQKISPAYESSVIDVDDGGASEEEGGIAELVAQLMELVQAMLERPKLRALLKGHGKNMLQLLVPFMRITEAQVSAWRADPNEFLQQEDDDHAKGCQVRLSGEGLVGSLMEHQKREGQRGIAAVAAELIDRGERGRTAGEKSAWKLTEVALVIFAASAAPMSTSALQRGELAPLAPIALTTAARVCSDSSAPEFLRSRAFSSLWKLGDLLSALSRSDVPDILRASAAGLAPTEPLAVRVSACRAFCRYLNATDDQALKDGLLLERGVLASLGALLQDAHDDLLELTLESLCLIIKFCPGAMVSVEASLGALVLQIWRRSRSNHMVYLNVLDVVSCAAGSAPELQLSMERHLVPAIAADLQSLAEVHDTATAIELLDVLLKRASIPFEPHLWECVPLVFDALMRCDESMLMQYSVDVLIKLVERSPKQITDAGVLDALLRCTGRLLGPELDDDGCMHVGKFVTLLLETFGTVLSLELRTGLLYALVMRLGRAERPYLQQELVVVLARLLLQDLQGVLQVLVVQRIPINGSEKNGLEVMLEVWLARAKEVRARLARNVTVSALCRLHARCGEDAQFGGLQIGGPSVPPLAVRLLDTIAAALEFENMRCKQHRDGIGTLAGDDAESDLDDDGELLDEDEGYTDGAAGGRKLEDYFASVCDLDDDDGSDCGDPVVEKERQDPFYTVDLRKNIAEYLVANGHTAAGIPELVTRISAALADVQANPV